VGNGLYRPRLAPPLSQPVSFKNANKRLLSTSSLSPKAEKKNLDFHESKSIFRSRQP